MKQRLVLAAVLAAAAVPLPAHAQAWLSDRQVTEGIGVRTGNFELHPGIGAQFGYNSNLFLRAGDGTPDERVIPVYQLSIAPSLSLSTLGAARRGVGGPPPAVAFRASVYATYYQLFATNSRDKAELDKQTDLHADAGATMRLDLGVARPIGADIYGDYQRVFQPSNTPGEDTSFDRDSVRGGLGVTWRPGGGLFEWRVGYEALYNYFEAINFRLYDNVQHAIQMRGRWRFLPRTALLYDGEYRFIRYTSNQPETPHDGDVARARVGINGLVGPRISLLGMVGWESSFYDGVRKNADSIIASAEGKYYVMAAPNGGEASSATTGLSTITLGFAREISNSYLNAYYTRTGAYVSAAYFLGGAFVATLDAGYNFYQFPQGDTFNSFTQNRLNARAFVEYRASNTFGVNASVMYDQTLSQSLQPRTGVAVPLPIDNLDFTRWQAFIGARWFM